MVTQYHLDGRVDLQEMVSDEVLYGLYKKAMGFLYLSLYEGFGLPVLESMALGCPVIGSNRTAVRDVVGGNGLLVDPQNPKEVAEAMNRLVRDSSLRGILIQRGLKSVEDYSWEKTAVGTHEVLEQVLRAKP
jgi:glycosyltransferase involved in cell wall biosynthesis